MKITSDPKILEIVEEYVIELLENPHQKGDLRPPKFSEIENKCMSKEISEMLEKGAIEKVDYQSQSQFLSHLFLRAKKIGGMRSILNLKKLNNFVKYQHFKMEGFNSVKNIVQKGDLLCSLHLKDE